MKDEIGNYYIKIYCEKNEGIKTLCNYIADYVNEETLRGHNIEGKTIFMAIDAFERGA